MDAKKTFRRPALPLLSALLCLPGCGTVADPLARLQTAAYANRVSVHVLNYCAKAGNKAVDFFAVNFSYRLERGQLLLDSDADGVADTYDNDPTMNLSPNQSDTAGLGYGDLFVFRMGIDATNQALLPVCANPGEDSDGDGISDCAERSLNSDPNNWNTAGDGIPDGLKLRAGLNPLDSGDALLNPAGDGWNNMKKVRANLPISESYLPYKDLAVTTAQDYAQASPGCSNYSIINMPIAPTKNGNHIQLYFIEQDPLGNRSLRPAAILLPSNAADGGTFEKQFTDLGV